MTLPPAYTGLPAGPAGEGSRAPGRPGDVPPCLGRAGQLVEAPLRAAVAGLGPLLAPVAEYHFGWRDAAGRRIDGSSGGKNVRAALALLSAEAAGAPAEMAQAGAVSMELVHNFSLLHDDLIDRDSHRRHRETVWSAFGSGQAVITGDALASLAYSVLLESDAPGAFQAARLLGQATLEMISGQAEDMAFESRAFESRAFESRAFETRAPAAAGAVTMAECRTMEAHKTGALVSCAAAIGAVLAGAPAQAVEALSDFGRHLGMAYQAVDDVLGIWGDTAITGKPTFSDLRQHKKTVPIVAAMERSGGQGDEPAASRRRLAELLGQPALSDRDLVEAAELVERLGGRDHALEAAEGELSLALAALREAPLDGAATAELDRLAHYVLDRDR
ncbi:MAG: polyprenyl synthetase family protein [Acidimicrobiales bacterium]